jgi:hypothetical protein
MAPAGALEAAGAGAERRGPGPGRLEPRAVGRRGAGLVAGPGRQPRRTPADLCPLRGFAAAVAPSADAAGESGAAVRLDPGLQRLGRLAWRVPVRAGPRRAPGVLRPAALHVLLRISVRRGGPQLRAISAPAGGAGLASPLLLRPARPLLPGREPAGLGQPARPGPGRLDPGRTAVAAEGRMEEPGAAGAAAPPAGPGADRRVAGAGGGGGLAARRLPPSLHAGAGDRSGPSARGVGDSGGVSRTSRLGAAGRDQPALVPPGLELARLPRRRPVAGSLGGGALRGALAPRGDLPTLGLLPVERVSKPGGPAARAPGTAVRGGARLDPGPARRLRRLRLALRFPAPLLGKQGGRRAP